MDRPALSRPSFHPLPTPATRDRLDRWRSRRTLTALAAACLVLLPGAAQAQTPPKSGDAVRLTLDQYERLMAAARTAALGEAAWGRASIAVTLPGPDASHATVRMSAKLRVLGEGHAQVPVLPADQVITEATFQGGQVGLTLRRGAHHLAIPANSGEGSVELQWLVPVRGGQGRPRHVVVAMPPVPGAELNVDGPSAATAQIWPAAGVSRGDETSASLPAGAAFMVSWGDSASQGAVRSAAYQLEPDASGDGVDVEATFEVQVGAFPVALRLAKTPAALVDVREGKTALASTVDDEWYVVHVRGAGAHTVQARFRVPIDRSGGQPQVLVPLDEVPITRVSATLPGKRAVTFEPEVPLVTQISGQGDRASTRVTGHLPPSESVTIRWTETRAAPESKVRFNTETWQLVTLSEGVLRSRIVLEYDVIRGKLGSLPIQIPDDVVVYKVEGNGVEDWRTFAKDGETPRQVRVTIAGSPTGKRTLEMQLERTAPQEEGAELQIPIVRPIGAFRELGAVALFDGEKVGFAPATSQGGFAKTGQDALPVQVRKTLKDKVNQAFKHVGPPGALVSKVSEAKKKDIRLDARVTALYTVEERTITGAAAIVVEVKSGRVDKLYVSLPEAVAEPRIVAPSLNKVEPAKDFDAGEGRKAYEVRFTQALEGALQIQVEFEMLLPKELGKTAVPDVRVHGAEVEEGTIGVSAEASIEVTPDAPKDLRRIDLDELPRALRRQSERELLFGYKYAAAPWQLSVDVKRHKTVQTLDAVVESAWIETNVLDNGHIVSRARYLVDNGARQFLRVRLTEGAVVLSVAAGGKEVKARQDEKGAIAIPLPASTKLLVELRYEVTVGKLGVVGWLDMQAPLLDIRQSKLLWMVRTPGDRSVFGLKTDLRKVDPELFQPPATEEGARGFGSDPMPEDYEQRVFSWAVQDADEDPLVVHFGHSHGAGGGLDLLLYVLALVGLLRFAWKKGRGTQGTLDTVLAVIAVLLLVAKGLGWGIGAVEALFGLVLVAAVYWAAKKTKAVAEELS